METNLKSEYLDSKSDILVISPCKFDIKRTIGEKELIDKIVRCDILK